ncbi:tigger transposable element-derived protein 4-like [Penaeus monodon]|uniref:tigger transposable element-derived protein 4-like n=1 Tax=Penaeus monodon TaxID=6687 RepID=UPI0018A719B7|nr:tigger transposable element-derived protein 4-like [Penaeus monodon]
MWKERLPEICRPYDQKDIFNLDESGLLYRALLDVRGTDCQGGKRSEERLTAMLCVNMKGEFEKPLIIGRCEKPHCFKWINTKVLPIIWKSNKRAWMTAALFKEWLEKFNEKMRRQKRNVILFLDNATCYPPLELSYVKLVFFPPNTSHLQPMNQEIIKTMKTHYRQMLLRKVIKDVENGGQKTNVSVLDACL